MNIARKAYLRLNQKDRIAEASQGIKNHNDDFAWQLILPTRKNESKDEEGSRLSLLNLCLDSSISDENLLKELMKWFPELNYYQTLLDTTPDLVAQREHPNKTLVLAVFGEEWVERSTSEVIAATNRLLLRLVYLRSLMRNDQTYFPLITPERFNYLCKNLVLPCCQDEERVIFLVLSTILDALGRTTKIQDKINKEHIPAEPGHDYKYGHEEYLRTYLKKFHFVDFNQGFRHFKDQTEKYQKLYYSNVVTNTFNLGAFVQGESVPYCLYELLKGGEDCQIRLLVLLISFLPIQYNERFEAEGFTNALYDQFTTALTVITETTLHKETGDVHISKVCIEAYNKYLKLNAQMVGVPVEIPGVTTEEEVLTLHRIVALSRSRFPIHWKKIWFVWKKLPLEDKKKLIRYMTVTGFDFDGETTSIYIYYAPAILSNTMRAAKNVEQFSTEQVLEYLFDKDAWTIGLYHGLLRLLKIYEGVTEKKAYHIYYGKDDADEASKMTVFDTEPLTAPSKEYTASS